MPWPRWCSCLLFSPTLRNQSSSKFCQLCLQMYPNVTSSHLLHRGPFNPSHCYFLFILFWYLDDWTACFYFCFPWLVLRDEYIRDCIHPLAYNLPFLPITLKLKVNVLIQVLPTNSIWSVSLSQTLSLITLFLVLLPSTSLLCPPQDLCTHCPPPQLFFNPRASHGTLSHFTQVSVKYF